MPTIALRREEKSQERRTPIPPSLVQALATEGVELVVQSAEQRIFGDDLYRQAGARVVDSLQDQQLIVGIKEIALEALEAGKTYLFFSHTIKGQPENRPLLARLMDLGCTLIDYERIVDAKGRRLVFFGRFAGLAGAIDTLWALGQRWALSGHDTPLASIGPATSYDNVDDALEVIAEAGRRIREGALPPQLSPLVLGVAGTGNTGQGVREIFDVLGGEELSADKLATLHPGEPGIYTCTFDVHHLVVRFDGRFDLAEYFARPYRYESVFKRYVPHLTVLMNCIYWEQSYPRLLSIRELNWLYRHGVPKLEVIGDISCDVRGGIEATVRATWPDDPVYVFDPDTGGEESGFVGPGPAIMAVYNLPAELPRDSSRAFGEQLLPYLAAAARADFDKPLDEIGLPPELLRAVIVHKGELTEDYGYLAQYL